MAVEYLFIALYLLALFGIFAAIVSYVENQRGGPGESKWEKRLILGGKIGYPVVVLAGSTAMGLYYLI